MKVYDTEHIRNLAVIGHGDAGKTQLISSLLHVAGATHRWGKVDEGTTVTDYDEDSIARKITLNTAALEKPQLISACAETFGSQCVVVAIDARRRNADDPNSGWEVYTHGGRRNVGLDAVEWAMRAQQLGAGEILLTSMDRDGTRNGYDIELTRAVSHAVRIPVIASGGAGQVEHFYKALTDGGASAVLAASLFHFGELSIGDVKSYLRSRRVIVR
jgi:cyclase